MHASGNVLADVNANALRFLGCCCYVLVVTAVLVLVVPICYLVMCFRILPKCYIPCLYLQASNFPTILAWFSHVQL